jgi:hypothetical protein
MADIDFMEYLEAEQIRTRAFIEAHKLLNAGQFKEAARKFIDLSTRMQDIDIDYAAEMFFMAADCARRAQDWKEALRHFEDASKLFLRKRSFQRAHRRIGRRKRMPKEFGKRNDGQ